MATRNAIKDLDRCNQLAQLAARNGWTVNVKSPGVPYFIAVMKVETVTTQISVFIHDGKVKTVRTEQATGSSTAVATKWITER